MKILLAGNPGSGKSVLFTRLTGSLVVSDNFPGTAIGFSTGHMRVADITAEVIDTPGVYSMESSGQAGEVARKMLRDGDVVVNVVNATNLERDLYLTMELLEERIPVVVALNVWDDAHHKGIEINLPVLTQLLGVPVIPTVATTGEGIKDLVESIPDAILKADPQQSREERWTRIGQIIGQVQKVTHRHHTFGESLADATVKPLPGTIIALTIAVAVFLFVVYGGEAIFRFIAQPVFNVFWLPVVTAISNLTANAWLLHDILIGRLVNGQIDFMESWGLLTTALYVPFALVLPYIITFYFALGLLEDTGYLPRLAVMIDTLMHRFGMHGYAIIPTIIGFGCNVPAMLATRMLESRKERFIAMTLIAIAVPCASLQALIIGLVGQHGIQYVIIIYATLMITWVVIGIILNWAVKGFTPELLIEIPPYRLMPWKLMLEKLWIRVRGFIIEAVPIMIIAVPVINLLYVTGIFQTIADFTAPVVSGLLGLPSDAIAAIFVAVFRMDAAMALLAPLQLTAKQLVVSSVVLVMFFPCIASLTIMLREMGFWSLLKALGIMIVTGLTVGALLNLLPI
jgi:ferrous iron transport protein B